MNRPESLPGGESPEAGREPSLLRRVGAKMLAAVRTPELTGEAARRLPPSILTAIKINETKLDRGNVENLLRSGFPNLAFYLAMKAAGPDDTVQVGMLQTMAHLDYDFSKLTNDHLSPALNLMGEHGDTHVLGGKLTQISRHGFQTWINKFDRILEPTLDGRPDATLFMTASAPYVGFDRIAAHSLTQGRPLGILKPSRFGQTELPVGFMLYPTGVAPGQRGDRLDIQPLEYDFERPSGAVIFDDVLKGGTVKQAVMDFWTEQTQVQPDFVSAVTVGKHF